MKSSIDIIQAHAKEIPFPLPAMSLTFTKDFLSKIKMLLASGDGGTWLREIAFLLRDLWECKDATLHKDVLDEIAREWDRVYFEPYGGNISGKQMLPWERLASAPPVLGSKMEGFIERMERLLTIHGAKNFKITPSHKPRYLTIHLSNGKQVDIISNRPNCDIAGFVKRYLDVSV